MAPQKEIVTLKGLTQVKIVKCYDIGGLGEGEDDMRAVYYNEDVNITGFCG